MKITVLESNHGDPAPNGNTASALSLTQKEFRRDDDMPTDSSWSSDI